jgi:histidinol-phosphate aminotransferase
LILDEAYVDFAPSVPVIDVDDPRVIRMLTFSKSYGMAGARVGYELGAPEIIAAFDKVRNHFGMARISQIGALAALQDQDWLSHVVAEVASARTRITRIAEASVLTAVPSAANFVAVDCGGDGILATRVLKACEARGVFIRKPFVAPQDRCIRISAGRPEDLDILAEVLPAALAEARHGN